VVVFEKQLVRAVVGKFVGNFVQPVLRCDFLFLTIIYFFISSRTDSIIMCSFMFLDINKYGFFGSVSRSSCWCIHF
jgi:hypothetical protein